MKILFILNDADQDDEPVSPVDGRVGKDPGFLSWTHATLSGTQIWTYAIFERVFS
jgi:hypothetical protein